MANDPAFTDAPAYSESSVVAESSRVVNFRREPILSEEGKNKFALLRQPGLAEYTNLSGYGPSCRGIIAIPNATATPGPNSTIIAATNTATRVFLVIGAVLLEIGGPPNKYLVNYGVYGIAIPDDGKNVWMAASPTQLAIVSGGSLVVFNLTLTGAGSGLFATTVTSGLIGTPNSVGYLDGFFVLTFVNSTQYQLSAINDATSWNAADVTAVSSRPDFLLAVHELKERLWFFGTGLTESVYNAGQPVFPFLSDISTASNVGLLAPASLERLQDTLFFLGTTTSGQPGAYKIEGQVIKSISNPAIDAIFSSYQNQADAYGWCYEESGHPCWRISFPDIDNKGNSRTWEYDDSLGPVMGWTETPFYHQNEQAHLGSCATNAFGFILVGSRMRPEDDISGDPGYQLQRLYILSSNYLDDNGQPIYRLRRRPHIYGSRKRVFLDRIEFDGNKGIGLPVAKGANYWQATSTLQVSYDGGLTFANSWELNWGTTGDRKARPYKANMGSGYDIVLQLVCTDPVDWMISAVDLDITVGLS